MFETVDWSALISAIIGIIIIAVPAAYVMAKKAGKEIAKELSGGMQDVAEAGNDSSAVVSLLAQSFDDDKITPDEVQIMKDKAMEAKSHMEEAVAHAKAIAAKFGK